MMRLCDISAVSLYDLLAPKRYTAPAIALSVSNTPREAFRERSNKTDGHPVQAGTRTGVESMNPLLMSVSRMALTAAHLNAGEILVVTV